MDNSNNVVNAVNSNEVVTTGEMCSRAREDAVDACVGLLYDTIEFCWQHGGDFCKSADYYEEMGEDNSKGAWFIRAIEELGRPADADAEDDELAEEREEHIQRLADGMDVDLQYHELAGLYAAAYWDTVESYLGFTHPRFTSVTPADVSAVFPNNDLAREVSTVITSGSEHVPPPILRVAQQVLRESNPLAYLQGAVGGYEPGVILAKFALDILEAWDEEEEGEGE